MRLDSSLLFFTRGPLWAVVAFVALAGCASSTETNPGTGGIAWTGSGGSQGGTTPNGGAGGLGGGGQGGTTGTGGAAGSGGVSVCPTIFTFKTTVSLSNPRVAGEWHNFELASATAMTGPSVDWIYEASVDLPPGLHAYKYVYEADSNTVWAFDPDQTRRKYVDGEENSAILVRDCNLPELQVELSTVSRPAPGQGTYQATLSYHDAIDGSGPKPSEFEATLYSGQSSQALSSGQWSVDTAGTVSITLSNLADGKYRLLVRAKTQSGQLGEPVRLIFWVEEEEFSWQDALIYMVMTDRFVDGDPSNNPPPTTGADPRADWFGGDLEGLRQTIAAGTLDELGVRAIWLTPFQTNPTGPFLAADGYHQVTGYHGYWPIKAREVDPRLGGDQALHDLVQEAHAHGIRILQDYVINHVHEQHEYMTAHPDWFRTGCVCGTPNCDWTTHALDCMFASYMPDINYTVPAATEAFVADAVWWLDTFDLDGLRVDAVKHVEEVATRNLSAAVRETFEAAGTQYFLMGETAMGWNECDDPCNDENYGTIAKYIGPHGLDGQFDFVLYHGVSYRTFAYDWKGMLHADYWFRHGQSKWPDGAIMTPYIGSHDTPRFVSLADYRGQDAGHDVSIPGNKWDNTAEAPGDGEPYRRMRIGMTWLLGLPGAPLLYYGDEYGQWGGADPNNRQMWRNQGNLSADELATLTWIRKLGTARQDLVALRRGDYVSLQVTEDTLVFARQVTGGSVAIVGLTRALTGQPVSVDVSSLGLSSGTTLNDALGGPSASVSGNSLSFTVPASSGVILAP